MNICVIGYGNVGGALARQWAKVGHTVTIGARNLSEPALTIFLQQNPNIKADTIAQATTANDVIVVTIPAQAVAELAKELGDLSGKIVIDTTNSVFMRPEPYRTGFEALQKLTKAKMAKCFNSTGVENMNDPLYPINGTMVKADMFVAGSDAEAKAVATQLAKDVGFECYDFGGDDQVELLEEVCRIWIHLAMKQGNGRNMAFKILKR
jgi:predicted dinucleotide-binding enzyme